jgi:hypothetical protein
MLAAEGTDAAGIASFLTIAFANAPTNFAAISGAGPTASEAYEVTTWPDHTHFVRCVIFHHKALPELGLAAHHIFRCDSTQRPDSPEVLFKMLETAVRANLPAGYSSKKGEHQVAGSPYEQWDHAGSPPYMEIETSTLRDTSQYSIWIEFDGT